MAHLCICIIENVYKFYFVVFQDLIDSDDLLAEEDLLRPDPTSLRSEELNLFSLS